MLRVSIQMEGEPGRVLEFAERERVSFGSAPDNDIVLAERAVSARHGHFAWSSGSWEVVEDGLGMRDGLTLNCGGARIGLGANGRRRHRVDGGDAIEIQRTRILVEAAAPPVVEPPGESEEPRREETRSTGSDPEAFEIQSYLVSETRAIREHRTDETETTPSDSPRGTDGSSVEGAIDDRSLDEVTPVAFSQVIDVSTLQQKLKSESRKLELILELAKDLNRLNELDDVLDRIGQAVFDALPIATHFGVFVTSDEGGFVPCFGSVRTGETLSLDQISATRSVLQLVREREMGLVFHGSDDQLDPSSSMISNEIAASMAVPLRGSKGVVGVMQIDNRESTQPFSQADLDLINVLGHSAAFALERAQLQAQIQEMFAGFVDASVTAIESRDPTTSGHSRRVSRFSIALAEATNRVATGPLSKLSFSDDQLTELAYAALLHDFGKVGVPEQVLVKANRLFPEQFTRVENRFADIRRAYRSTLLTNYVQSGAKTPDPPEALRVIDRACEEFDRKLRRMLAFLRGVDSAERLSPAEVAGVETIAKSTFTDAEGMTHRYLEVEELEALMIPAGTLTPSERRAIESHVMQSFRFLCQIPWPKHLAELPDIVVAHHEKLDGSGYPRGLVAREISPQARLLTVVDIFDAVTASDRPYRAAMPVERGLDLLVADAREGKLDHDFVRLFIEAGLWQKGNPAVEEASLERLRSTAPAEAAPHRNGSTEVDGLCCDGSVRAESNSTP